MKTSKESESASQVDAIVIRRKILSFTEDFLIEILSGNAVVTNIPDDAKIIRTNYNYKSGHWDVVLEHNSFEPVTEGEEYPNFIGEVKAV